MYKKNKNTHEINKETHTYILVDIFFTIYIFLCK